MRKLYLTAFLSGFTTFFLYQSIWWALRYYGFSWYTQLNLPGAVMALSAYPWSLAAYSFSRELYELFGNTGRYFVTAALASIGLGVNLLAIVFTAAKAAGAIKRVRT